jgi:CheY-like chemotaxis protein
MPLEKPKILVVDDYPDICQMLVAAFEREGISAVCASNGFDGLKEFEKGLGSFSAVLIDYAMPGMDGLTVALRIRQMEKEREVDSTLVAFFTGHYDLKVSAHVKKKLGVYRTFSKTDISEMVGDISREVNTPTINPPLLASGLRSGEWK